MQYFCTKSEKMDRGHRLHLVRWTFLPEPVNRGCFSPRTFPRPDVSPRFPSVWDVPSAFGPVTTYYQNQRQVWAEIPCNAKNNSAFEVWSPLSTFQAQDNVHTNMASVQCISIVYSICLYIISELFRLVEKNHNVEFQIVSSNVIVIFRSYYN